MQSYTHSDSPRVLYSQLQSYSQIQSYSLQESFSPISPTVKYIPTVYSPGHAGTINLSSCVNGIMDLIADFNDSGNESRDRNMPTYHALQ